MHDHDGPTGEHFEFDGVEYFIKTDVLAGKNTKLIKKEIEKHRWARAQGLIELAGQPGTHGEGYLRLAERLMKRPLNSDVIDSLEDETYAPMWLTLCVEPKLLMPRAQQIVDEYPHFALLSKALVRASGFVHAAKNLFPPSERLGETTEESPLKSVTETLPESMGGPSTKSNPLATTSSA